jgi:endoglucanase
MMQSNRRQFIETLASTSAACALEGCGTSAMTSQRWRGFNLQEKFTDRPDEWASMDPEWGHSNEPFVESDFEWIARFGFNFVRLPMSYRCWTDPHDPFRLLEPTLLQIDQAVNWGRQYGIHTCLNFHRAPGFCINGQLSPEPWNLWTDQLALDICTFHWTQFAQRYKGLPSVNVSFNLINEPNGCTMAQYTNVVHHVSKSIKEVDPNRLIMIDGLFGETSLPVPELLDVTNTVHSTRGYAPFSLTHYLAPWAGTPNVLPTWPTRIGQLTVWDKDRLDQLCILPAQGLCYRKPSTRLFVGEWGCWNRTPHDVTLKWMRDFLELWKKAGWGWALWCFRGSFGILDSNRRDVQYEDWQGHKLDRKMLELLQEF